MYPPGTMRRLSLALLGAAFSLPSLALAQSTVVRERYGPNGPPPTTNASLYTDARGGVPSVLTCSNGASTIERGAHPLPRTAATIDAACPALTADTSDLDSRVRDVRITSVALNGIAWARVILPKGYHDAANAAKRYPVLFLLAGRGSSYQAWTCNTLIQNYVADTDVIVVMPDGSRKYNPCAPSDAISSSAIPGWYSNWWQRSLDNNPERWETFLLGEVKAIVEADFRTNASYAIAGVSMGGYGAMYLATRTDAAGKKLFKSAASFSGLLNTVSSAGFTAVNGTMLLAGQSTDAVWGFYPGTPGALLFGTRWFAHNPTSLMAQYVPARDAPSTIPLFVSVGDGFQGRTETTYDAAAGALELGARYTHEDFIAAMVTAYGGALPPNVRYYPHPGTHTWRNWDTALCLALPTLLNPLLPADKPFVPPPALPCNPL